MKPIIRPTKKQDQAWKAWYDPAIRFLGFGGGGGGGKSWAFCEMLLVQAYTYPGTRSFIARNELKRLMQSTYVTWLKVCSFHKIPSTDWKLNGQYNYIEFTNGSRIDLLDVAYQPSDPLYERFGSLEYTNGWIEEAGEVKQLAFEVLKSRVGRCKNVEYNLAPKIALTFNPKKGWLYDLMYRPWKNGTLPKDTVFIQALYTDNPYTREDYGKMLGSITDTAMRQRLMDGNWDYDDDPTCLIEYPAIVDLFYNVVPQSNQKYLTADIARYGSDKITFYCWRGLECYKIIEKSKQGVDETAQDIRTISRDELIPFDHIIADEDGVGGGVVDLIRGIHGFQANSAPLLENGKLPNFRNLKAQCSYKIAELINNRHIRIKCESTEIKEKIEDELQQIKTFRADMDGKKEVLPKDKVKEVLGRSPDHSDAIMMRAWFEFRGAKPFDGLPTTRFAKKR